MQGHSLDWMNWDYSIHGGDTGVGGFGRADLDKMIEQGYSPAQIRIMANTAVSKGRTPIVYRGVQDWVGANTTKPPWMYGKYGDERFGKMDLQAARGQGHGFETIKGYADFAREHGIGVGDYVEDYLANEQGRRDEARQTQAIADQAKIDQDERSRLEREQSAANALLIAQATDRGTAAMEAQRAKDRRVKTSSPLSTGGTGSFRAKGLTTSQNKRGGGTSQFKSTNPYFQSTLNTGSGKKTTAKSTLNI